MRAQTVDLGGPVHFVDFGGEGPTLVLVHGLGGSHLNWQAVGAGLSRFGRVLAIDLVGFGLTEPLTRSSSVEANRTLLDRFLDRVVGRPSILVGNSMGGLLSLSEAAQAPDAVAGLVLVAPAQPITSLASIDRLVASTFAAYATPLVGEMVLRRSHALLGPEGMVKEMMHLCCSDPSRISADVFAAHVELARHRHKHFPWAHTAFLEAARSLLTVIARRGRYAELARQVRCPTLVVQGDKDRLVPIASSRELVKMRPDWLLEVFDGIGHVPQLEAPERFLQSMERWFEGAGAQALATAQPAA